MSIAQLKAAASGEAVRLYEERELLGDFGPIWYREYPRWPRRRGFYLEPDVHPGDPLCTIAKLLSRREPAAVARMDGMPYFVVDSAHHLDLYDHLARLAYDEWMHEAWEHGPEDYHFPSVQVADRFSLFGFRVVLTEFGPAGQMDIALIDEEGEQVGGTTIVDCVVKPLPRDEEVYVEPIRALPRRAVGRKHLIRDLGAIIENGLA